MARLAYFGTPELAVPPLRALLGAGHEIVLVVTRPDRRRGRGPATSPSPVKAAATELGLRVAERVDDVLTSGAELGVVVAYGRIIPRRVLESTPMVNLHFSLLPRWRGAAPLERAILSGDERTGVCVMALDEGLDTGPLYECEEVAVDGADLETLRARLVAIGSRMLVDLLGGGASGLPTPRPQVGEPTYAEKLDPGELRLHFDEPAEMLARTVRLGRAWTEFRGRRVKVLKAEAVDDDTVNREGADRRGGVRANVVLSERPPPGTLVGDCVVAGSGMLHLVSVQPEGRDVMDVSEWRRGARPEAGDRLG